MSSTLKALIVFTIASITQATYVLTQEDYLRALNMYSM